jgi:uncharacterized protein (TIGR03437 family)
MNRPTTLLSALAATLLVPPAAAQGLYGRNLVVNGDAESGPGMTNTRSKASPIPGWTTYGAFTVLQYSSADGISLRDEGPVDRGKNFFVGGNPAATRSYAEQVIRLEGVETGAKFYFSAFLGMNYGDGDPKAITVTASFTNDKGDVIQEAVLNGPKSGVTDFDMPGGLLLRAMTGFLTTGVTQVKITLDFGTVSGSSENAYAADNISLVLAQEPFTGVNLIVNGDGEVPDGKSLPGWTASRPDDLPVPGWSAPPYLLANKVTDWLGNSEPGPALDARGRYILVVNSPRSSFTASQAIDISAPKASGLAKSKLNELIDTGKVSYQLSGWLGQYKDNSDPIKLRVSFYDGVKADPVATGEIGPVLSGDHGGSTGLAQRQYGGSVPSGTRRILVELLGTKVSPPTDNMRLLADNLSLVLTAPDTGVKLLGISNAASGAGGNSVAPGEMVTLAVSGIDLTGSTSLQLEAKNTSLARSLSGVTVTFDTVQAPLLYVSATQIGAIVPFEVYGKDQAPAQVSYKGDKSAPVTVNVVPALPGVFTQEAPGSGNTAALVWNADWTLNSSANPASKGSLLTVFWTGGGQTDPAGVTGRIELGKLPRPLLPVSVRIDGQPAELLYAGAVPNSWAGLLMAQVKVPDGASTGGPVSVTITLSDPGKGDLSSPSDAATIWLQ